MKIQQLIDLSIEECKSNSHDAEALIASLRIASALAKARVYSGDDVEWEDIEWEDAWWFEASRSICSYARYKEVLQEARGWWV